MQRSSYTGGIDSKVEKTTRANRKAKKQEESLSTIMLSTSNSESKREDEVLKNIAKKRILKELATPNMNQQPSCIEFPNIDVAFELNFGLIHLQPTLYSLADEDPHKDLKKFHVVCSTMKLQ